MIGGGTWSCVVVRPRLSHPLASLTPSPPSPAQLVSGTPACVPRDFDATWFPIALSRSRSNYCSLKGRTRDRAVASHAYHRSAGEERDLEGTPFLATAAGVFSGPTPGL